MKSIITSLHALFQCQFMCLKSNTIIRAWISLAFILLFALQLQAQCTTPNFAQAKNYATGESPASVAIGDVDGDGNADLAVANHVSNNVSVLLNNGNGTFAAAVSYATGSGPASVAIGDVNGDGKADLAVANIGSRTVSVLLNNGSGTFAAAVSYATGVLPVSVAIGDVDGDGKADLAVVNSLSNTVSVLLNNGNGTFAAAVNYATGYSPFSVAIDDVNGDGKADLAVAIYSSNNVSVLLNQGNGTFAAPVNYATGSGPRSVAIGDVDGDGKADLAVAIRFSNTVAVLLNKGSGTFAAPINYATGIRPSSVVIGDVNGDGKADLAVANEDSNNVSVLLNNGNGTFAAAVNYATGSGPASVAIGDVNGDGTGDLAVANSSSNTVSVLLNNCSVSTATTIRSSPNPSCQGTTVTFTAIVTSGSNTLVKGGGVTFTQGSTVLADSIPVDANGKASISTDTLAAGSHTLVATYKTASGFTTSNNFVIHTVNARPTGAISGGGTYCNGSNTTTDLTLTVTVTGSGTISGTLSDGTSFSGTAPAIQVSVSPTATTTYTISGLSDANCTAQSSDLSGNATVTVNARPSTPVVTVMNNCGSSTLSTTAAGSLLWSTGETTSSITVSTTGNYTVTQTVNGCTSDPGSGTAAPNAIPSAPVVTVSNNCGSSTLSTTTYGSLLWSTSETTPSITVSNAGSYTVTQTVNGCTSDPGSGTAAPNAIPSTPVVTVSNNCGSSTLSTTATGTLLWSTNETSSSINVSNGGNYTVTQTVNGCTSAAGSADATPKAIPSAPSVTVANNCGSSTLSTTATGTLLWSTGEMTSSITVSTAGNYTVTQTIYGCTSAAGSGNAAPKTAPSKPVVTPNGSTDFCQGGSIVLSAPAGFASYKWSNNATTQTITVTQSGSYSVVVTNAAGCSSPASDAITVTVGNDTQKPVITCPAAVTLCYDATENYTIASLQATDNCGIASISYTLTGATTRSGSGADASGKFSSGTSTITWTVKDGSGNTSTCQSNVTVNEKFIVSIPDGWALGSGCTLNTVYKGYTPASYILLIAKPTGGKSPYTYKWSNGSTASFILVNPGSATTYTVTVKDAKGCTQSASKQINVVDVRCGSKMDKVTLCYKGNTLCSEQKDVASYLLKGAYFGNCKGKSAAGKSANEIVQKEGQEESDLTIKVSPNPAATYFKLTVNSGNVKDKISISIIDEVGRAVETRTAGAGQTLQLGDRYHAGVYFAQAIQGNKRVTLKLIKQAW